MIFFRNLIFAASALICLVACGGAQETSAPEPAPTPPTTENIVQKPDVTPISETENPFEALPEPYQSANYDVGRRTFRQCSTCHSLVDGGPHLLGPNLYGVFGREVGGVETFKSYSKASQDADFIWTPELLDEWLANPREFLPGNGMSFAGLRRPTDRLAVIAYIMSETGYAAPE